MPSAISKPVRTTLRAYPLALSITSFIVRETLYLLPTRRGTVSFVILLKLMATVAISYQAPGVPAAADRYSVGDVVLGHL
jgi:hypothetical protein